MEEQVPAANPVAPAAPAPASSAPVQPIAKIGRIEIDRDLCIGATSCVVVAPDVFEMDESNIAIVKNPKGASDADILEAAKACPTTAIYLYDEAGNRIYP